MDKETLDTKKFKYIDAEEFYQDANKDDDHFLLISLCLQKAKKNLSI